MADGGDPPEPGRLAVLKDQMPALFLRSGNRCAFPGCTSPIMNGNGDLIGQVAHIAAVSPGGPRHLSGMTNDELRQVENLILLCYEHHVTIDQHPTDWPPEKLQEMKLRHEAIYTDAIDQLATQIGDVTAGTRWMVPTTLVKLGLGEDAEELAGNLEVIDDFLGRLAKVPMSARSVLALVLDLGEPSGLGDPGEIAVPYDVLISHANCTREELHRQLKVLEHHKFLDYGDDWDGNQIIAASNSSPGIGWPLFVEIHKLANQDSAIVRRALLDLDLTIFDM